MNASLWRGRRVLITGHTGFKGGWLATWLGMMGAEVAGYAMEPPSTPNFFEIVRVADELKDVRGDIRDAASVERALATFDPEVVFHLAAQPIVRRGYADPVDTYATNVVGTASVLQACRSAANLKAIISVTTDKCYENREWDWGYRETDRLGGFDPYSSSKACAELVTDAFRRSFFCNGGRHVGVATARSGNVIGGGDWGSDRLFPDLARSVATGRPVLIRNGEAVRPWQHVLEPIRGYILLAEHLLSDPVRYSGPWNFGPPPSAFRTVDELIALASRYWNGKLQYIRDAGEHPHETARLLLDSNKSASHLGWISLMDINESVRLTVEWYEACTADSISMKRFTTSQISAYAALQSAESRQPS